MSSSATPNPPSPVHLRCATYVKLRRDPIYALHALLMRSTNAWFRRWYLARAPVTYSR